MKKRYSITTHFTFIMIALVTGTVALCWFLNNIFLEGFYSWKKQNALLEGMSVIETAAEEGKIHSSESAVTFEKICTNNNISMLILGQDGTIVWTSARDIEPLKSQFFLLFNAGGKEPESKILMSNDNYMIEEQKDERTESEYLTLWGSLPDGNLIIMRTPLASIRASVIASNEFLTYIMIVALISAVAVAVMAGRNISGPLVELTSIAKRMVELDFNAKYKMRKHVNEIDVLGSSMNQLSEELESTISELKSVNNELRRDIQRKEEIDEMRKEFLANVSHELKTPLALIQGYAEGLQESVTDDEESRNFYCEVITDEARKMNHMVKKLLTLNELEWGQESVTMERFNITELIQGLVTSNHIRLEQNGIHITAPQEEVYVWGDEFKVEEVLSNYLSNAIHHVDDKKRITISYTHMKDVVRISVFNTGKNIPPEDIPHIWDKFYKVDKAHTREYGGSGIGLSIVKAVMESMNQAYGVVNHKDGIEFWMELDNGSNNS